MGMLRHMKLHGYVPHHKFDPKESSSERKAVVERWNSLKEQHPRASMRYLYHGTSCESAHSILNSKFTASTTGMYGPGVYLCDHNGLDKPAWFAMRCKSNDRDNTTFRVDGAIIVCRVLLGTNEIPTPNEVTSMKDGKHWYKTEWPGSEATAIVGKVKIGYPANDTEHPELNEIPEYVCRDPDFILPVFAYYFKRETPSDTDSVWS